MMLVEGLGAEESWLLFEDGQGGRRSEWAHEILHLMTRSTLETPSQSCVRASLCCPVFFSF